MDKNFIDKMQCRVSLCMPDGTSKCLWISKDESCNNAIEKFFANWYKVTNENPDLFGHISLEENCPNCGEKLRAKEYRDDLFCWCPVCHHQERRSKND